ncbi:amidohydrolase family protein [Sulfolobus sp. E11-6]|uniref:amidohydrolase family protein n=1 Tax=Sulfolobus sp. E11-6 TaxID=2663020 RepID=UPI001297F37C|nr:amidohydrolase family protein [Sulfolobus sp. E11-6]QGA68977.1 amidohydrolase family protein [Sulfolobus sp. E11-6]
MDSKIIDIHSHFYPKVYIDALNRKGLVRYEENKIVITWGRRVSPADSRLLDIEKKLQDIKRLRREVFSLLSLSAPWTYILPKEDEIIVARQVNEEVAKIVSKYPEYFGGLATLPLNDVNASIEEAERAVKELGLNGFIIGTGIGNKTIADDEYRPLLKKISQLGKPIFIHPGTLPLDRVLDEGVEAILTSFIFETTYVITKLALKGILRDYGVAIIVPHGGGFIPYQLGRIELGYESYNLGKLNPSKDLKEFVYYDTVIYTKESLELLIKVIGEDHIVFGTDHPFPVAKPELFLQLIDEVVKNNNIKEKILMYNANKIFKFFK